MKVPPVCPSWTPGKWPCSAVWQGLVEPYAVDWAGVSSGESTEEFGECSSGSEPEQEHSGRGIVLATSACQCLAWLECKYFWETPDLAEPFL